MKKKLSILLITLCLLLIPTLAVWAEEDDLHEYTGKITEEHEKNNDPLYEKYNGIDAVANSAATMLFSTNSISKSSSISWGKGLTHGAQFADSKKSYGIDVSKWQGNIDWAKVKEAGVEFAIIRLGYRGKDDGKNTLDKKFVANIEGAHNAGIKVSVYFYTQAITKKEAREEAEFCVKYLEPYASYIEFPVMYDIENTTKDRMGKAKLNTEKRTKFCLAFSETIEANGYKAGVYSYKNYFETKLTVNDIAAKYFIWLAEWKKEATYTGNYGMWQYSDGDKKNSNIISYTIPGISGAVDLDVVYEYVPAKVTGVKMKDASDTTISLSWDAIEKVDGYEVFVSNANGEVISTTAVTDTAATVAGLETGSEFIVKVRAYYYFDNSGNYAYGSYSSETKMYTNPSKVENVYMKSYSKNSVTLKWAAVSGATSYNVYSYDTAKKTTTKIASVTSTSYTVKNLAEGKKYSYKIRAYKKLDSITLKGKMSDEYQAATKAAKITNLKATKVKANSVAFSWTKLAGVSGYEIHCYNSKGKEVDVITSSKNTVTFKELAGSTAYSFKVRAYIKTKSEAYAKGQYSAAIKVVTYPEAVDELRVSKVTDKTITFKWDKLSGVSGYYVYSYNGKASTLVATVKTNSYTFKKLNKATKYGIKVVAFKKNGNQILKGAAETFEAYTKPDKVTKLTLTGGEGSNKIKLKWTKVANAKGYRVCRYNSEGELIDYVDVTKTSYTYKNHMAGVYTYRVKALLKTADYVTLASPSKRVGTYVTPGQITGVNVYDIYSGTAQISWDAMEGVDGYYVMLYNDATGKYDVVSTEEEDAASVLDNLVSNKTYKVKVVAFINYNNNKITGIESEEFTFTTPQM